MRLSFAIASPPTQKDNTAYPVKRNGNMPVEQELPPHSTLAKQLDQNWQTIMLTTLMAQV